MRTASQIVEEMGTAVGTAARILVAGAGAVGGLLGGRLVQHGRDVAFLVRPGRARRLSDRGLRIVAADRTDEIPVRPVTAAQLTHPYDLIVLSVKADAIAGVLEDLTPAVGPDTCLVPFLNGMAHLDVLASRFDKALLGGTLKVVSQLNEQGDVAQLAPTVEIEIGELDGGPSPRLRRAIDALTIPGFSVHARDDIVDAMWEKWVFIASIGAVTGLMRDSIGHIVAMPAGRAFAETVLDEATAVARAAGHPVADARVAATRSALTAPGSTTTSSLSRDLLAGRPTEVEAVLGDLARRADDLGVAVPSIAAATLALRLHNHRLAEAR
ncbi:ketopantoate reductase family protein [Actinopolymorpha pittospori]